MQTKSFLMRSEHLQTKFGNSLATSMRTLTITTTEEDARDKIRRHLGSKAARTQGWLRTSASKEVRKNLTFPIKRHN